MPFSIKSINLGFAVLKQQNMLTILHSFHLGYYSQLVKLYPVLTNTQSKILALETH